MHSMMRQDRMLQRGLWLPLLLLPFSCSSPGQSGPRYRRAEIQKKLKTLERPGLRIGDFHLASDGVLDGDTIKVEGLQSTLRLLGIDTEETFKSKADRQLFAQGWEHYWKTKTAGQRAPIKAATPMGEEAKEFAKNFFAASDGMVRLERDHPREIRGYYNRYLTYAFVKRDGRWLNYNVECVRAGMSPYFTKYGYSHRFHEQFMMAQKEAQQAARGIWKPGAMAYTDYPERFAWWNGRAAFIKKFEQSARGLDGYIMLTHWDAMKRLEQREGKEVTILGSIGKITLGDKGPTKVMLSFRMHSDFSLIFFDKDVFGSSGIARYEGEFIRVTGIVSRYFNRWKKRHELQMVIHLPGQIVGSAIPAWKRQEQGIVTE